MRRRPFLPALLIGIAMLGIALLLMFPRKGELPPAQQKTSPVVLLEFARTPQEVYDITLFEASQAEHAQMQAYLRRNIQMDTWFILAYTCFLVVSIFIAWRLSGKRWYLLPVLALALAAGVFDFLENAQLMGILDKLSSDFQAELSRLVIYTHIKWGAMVAVFVGLIPFTWPVEWSGKVLSIAAGVGLLMAIGVWVAPGESMYQAYAGVVVLLFVLLLAFEWLFSEDGNTSAVNAH